MDTRLQFKIGKSLIQYSFLIIFINFIIFRLIFGFQLFKAEALIYFFAFCLVFVGMIILLNAREYLLMNNELIKVWVSSKKLSTERGVNGLVLNFPSGSLPKQNQLIDLKLKGQEPIVLRVISVRYIYEFNKLIAVKLECI